MSTQIAMTRIAALRPSACERTDEVLVASQRSAMIKRILATPATTDVDVTRATRAHPRRVAVIASAAAVTATTGLVGAGVALTSGAGAKAPDLASGAAVKARLLSAIDTTSDIIETSTTWADGSSIVDWSNASGTINHTIQTGWPETLNTVTSSGSTFVAMYPATKTWLAYSSASTDPGGGMIAVDDLRSQVQSGTLSVIATNVELDGQSTTELLLTDPPLPASADSDLWVTSSTDLPVRESPPGSTNGATNWTYYSPGSAAAMNLTMPIPPGYTQVPVPASDIFPPGGKLPFSFSNGATGVASGVTCPLGNHSCLVYPRTLPLPSSAAGT